MNVDELYTKEHHEEGSVMQVKDANGKKLSMFITLKGIDSKAFRAATVKLQRALLKNVDGDGDLIRAEALASVTISWKGFKSKSKKLEFTTKRAEQLYYNAPYVMDQVDIFVTDRTNFTKG